MAVETFVCRHTPWGLLLRWYEVLLFSLQSPFLNSGEVRTTIVLFRKSFSTSESPLASQTFYKVAVSMNVINNFKNIWNFKRTCFFTNLVKNRYLSFKVFLFIFNHFTTCVKYIDGDFPKKVWFLFLKGYIYKFVTSV